MATKVKRTEIKSMEFDGSRTFSERWAAIKNENPELILLYRMGDAYEAYSNDAAVVSNLAGLTIGEREGLKMCCFPHHVLEPTLRKILEAGLRAAICEWES